MKPVFQLTVYGTPVAQPRQRHRQVQSRSGMSLTMNYTARTHPVQQFKADIKAAALQAGLLPAPLEGPLVLECRFYFPRPKRLMRRKDPDGPIWHTSPPDLDNTYKAVKDALKSLVYRDDSQVVSYGPNHGKWYAEKDGRPRLELTIYTLGTEDGACAT